MAFNQDHHQFHYYHTILQFDYNLFYGQHPESEPTDAHKIISDPMFICPGSGGIGITAVEGYKLNPNSPCINSGKSIPNGAKTDFWERS